MKWNHQTKRVKPALSNKVGLRNHICTEVIKLESNSTVRFLLSLIIIDPIQLSRIV